MVLNHLPKFTCESVTWKSVLIITKFDSVFYVCLSAHELTGLQPFGRTWIASQVQSAVPIHNSDIGMHLFHAQKSRPECLQTSYILLSNEITRILISINKNNCGLVTCLRDSHRCMPPTTVKPRRASQTVPAHLHFPEAGLDMGDMSRVCCQCSGRLI